MSRSREVAEYLRYLAEMGVEGLEPRGGRRREAAPPAEGAPRPPGRHEARLERLPSMTGELFSDRPVPPAGLDARAALEWIRTEWVGDCTRCKLHDGRTHLVFGVGDPRARLMFVGEGPGRDEDLQGEPFVGRAGQLLTRIIEAIGLRRDETYIANVIKCRPPDNRTPEPDEVAACRGFLEAQIEVIAPEVLVLLGKVAAQTLLGDGGPIGRLRGRFRDYRGIPAMVTWHPAYLLRNPAAKAEAWADMKQVRDRLGRRDG